ncbi:MAG TPA: phosphomethylpyrimidine synthase ThiC [Thermodesulfovibrio thiophilus]|nr:phosphomethylpyrimidine synthase ThiC [Thermodesulfovibrio thiophilus]HOA83389.1 phosphomethylpyrimidine synthase ThiC [Thermodesulfovibrio thiophilus]HQA03847.1 phosphomethylpyrimidine synthase ThiC [Thermodesulfovibrio thiophilus]
MTRIQLAKKGIITEEMKQVAMEEDISPDALAELIVSGKAVITRNKERNIKPLGIGKGLRTKINANIGTSKDKTDIKEELEKLQISVKYGADAVMDLSTGGPLKEMRKSIIEHSPVSLGTVPIYEVAVRAIEKYGSIVKMTVDDIFEVIEQHAMDGVDFITVHCGVTMKIVEMLKKGHRVLPIVSRGGSILADWICRNERENPLYEYFDRLIDIAKKYDLTLSLGDGMRPGCLADATDKYQILELITIGKLKDIAVSEGVQCIIEGPGHLPLNHVETNIKLQKHICKESPFYVLGPLVTDCAMGYDHIAAAIGGAIAGYYGADFLCYVTPSEHIRLPDKEDVKEGVIASKIAAHAADLAKGNPKAWERDKKMADCRRNFDWQGQISLCFNPDKVKAMREERPPVKDEQVCSMCGEFCAIKISRQAVE